mgnify:CR=1 FL=1
MARLARTDPERYERRGVRLDHVRGVHAEVRGPIGAELAVVLAELKPPLVVFCPANPAAGRTVRHTP